MNKVGEKMQTDTTDQQRFDEAVIRRGKVVLQALAGVGILAAVLMSMVALNQSGEKRETVTTAQSAGKQSAVVPAAAASQPAASAAAAKTVALKIIGSYKTAADGKKHDAFTVTDFTVKVGQPMTLKIDNTDDVPHSITAPAAGVNIITQPGVHNYILLAKTAGKFEWYCMLPCDSDTNGWAMQNPGYMSGYITAT
jgi:heme/copper-type cytochrome/quinol oxidase subunit 2